MWSLIYGRMVPDHDGAIPKFVRCLKFLGPRIRWRTLPRNVVTNNGEPKESVVKSLHEGEYKGVCAVMLVWRQDLVGYIIADQIIQSQIHLCMYLCKHSEL